MRHLFLLLLLAAPAFAQLSPGKDCYCWPPGAKAGQTVDVVLAGSDWTPDVQFFVSDSRVRFQQLAPPGNVLVPEPPFWFGIKSFDNDPRLPREVPARLTLPADLPPGPVRWSVANANGAAAGGVFVVGSGDEVTEDETRKGPQAVSLPVTVNGRLRRIEEVDRYQFIATTTGLVTADLFARRLGNEFNGVLAIQSDGKLVAEAVDTEGTDPTVTFAVTKGKTYTLAVRDVDHRGYRNFTYRLVLTTGPRMVAALPMCGRVGERREVEFIGFGLATGSAKSERVTVEVEFPRTTSGSFVYRLATPFGDVPFTLHVTDSAERTEAVGRTLPGPCGVSGRFDRRGERDTFTFVGRMFELWDIAVLARRYGSPVDPRVVVLGPDGKQLAAADDTTGSADPRASVTLPADGTYTVVVSDASGKVPTPEFVYRLELRRPTAGFRLKVPGFANVPIGGKATLTVEAIREGGFKGPITLALSGLPEGVTQPKELVIPPGAPSLAIPLDCAKTAGVSTAFLTLSGTATLSDKPLSVTAVDRVLLATTLKPPFKVKSPEADGTRKVFRGATHLADLVVERSEGFAGEILLDMAGAQQRHRQGIRGPVFKVAPGDDRVLYPVTLPEHLESTRTSRIGLVALAKVPDPTGKAVWVQAAMDGQVTMSVEGALMKLSPGPDEPTAVCGEPVAVSLKLSRSPKLTGTVKIELLVPAELSGVMSADPLDWPADQPTATLVLKSKPDRKLAGVHTLTARATATRNGFPVVSECEIEVEFVARALLPVPSGK